MAPEALAQSQDYRHPGAWHRDDGTAICRLRFRQDRIEEGSTGWPTDHPKAEDNLTTRLGEVTHVRPSGPWVVGFDAALFLCPLVLVSDMGTMRMNPLEAEVFRAYLSKGGFFWSDDTWGPAAWGQILRELGQVLPPGSRVETPTFEHPIYHMLYRVSETLQVSHLGYWQSHGGEVAERGEDSPLTPLRLVLDGQGRPIGLLSHNTDIADTWEREGDSDAYFDAFALDGYAAGINAVLFTLTH